MNPTTHPRSWLIGLSLFSLLGSAPASSDDPAQETLVVQSFRSGQEPFPVTSAVDGERCKAAAVLPEGGDASAAGLRIACGAALHPEPDWQTVAAHPYTISKPEDKKLRGKLEIEVDGARYLVKASYVRLAKGSVARAPACSAIGDQARTMGASQGSGKTLCDPTR